MNLPVFPPPVLRAGCTVAGGLCAAEGGLRAGGAVIAFAAAAAVAQYGTPADYRLRPTDWSALALNGGDSAVAALPNV